MVWDDDEQYVPQAEPAEPLKPVNNVFADEQRNSLVFSTEDLKNDYHKLKYVSKEWTSKEDRIAGNDLRKTTTQLVTRSPIKELD